MKPQLKRLVDRRGFFKAAGTAAAGVAALASSPVEAAMQNVNTRSKPSELKITDLRVAEINKGGYVPIIRVDTNQGISGWGEVRDGADPRYALMLKSRILGMNPCNVDQVFRKIKQFGGHARQGGGVCAVEMAMWDLAGKAYNVPAYQMLGGRFRDNIRIYCDTPISMDPTEFGKRMRARVDKGFTFLKMDLGTRMFPKDAKGLLTEPLGEKSVWERTRVMHMFTGQELTPKGVEFLASFVDAVREQVGMEVPLAADHFGHIGVNSCIRLGRALEKYNMAWLEDMIPWQHMDLMKQITDAVDIPILTGEDIYLKEDFQRLVDMHAVDIVHPDLATSGGLLETKKIGDLAQEGGVAMAMHFAGSPISFMANIHCAAATENFLCLEHHSVDVEWWEDLVTGIDKPLVNRGFVKVPERPGLGVELNEEVAKKYLRKDSQYGWFNATSEWDTNRSNDRLWS